MNTKRTFFHLFVLTLFLSVCVSISSPAQSSKNDGGIYVFGVGTNFNDSVMYMSAPQLLKNVRLTKKTGQLPYRLYYSNQFKDYLEANVFGGYETCAVFFAKSRKQIEKKYVSLRKKYRKNKNLKFKEIPSTEFSFRVYSPAQTSENK